MGRTVLCCTLKLCRQWCDTVIYAITNISLRKMLLIKKREKMIRSVYLTRLSDALNLLYPIKICCIFFSFVLNHLVVFMCVSLCIFYRFWRFHPKKKHEKSSLHIRGDFGGNVAPSLTLNQFINTKYMYIFVKLFFSFCFIIFT